MSYEQITDIRQDILKRWIDVTFSVYPENTVRLLNSVKDQFRNPVGQTIRTGLDELLRQILSDAPIEAVPPALDRILRIRSVQEIAAADAVRFLLDLKPILTTVFASHGNTLTPEQQLRYDRTIDRLVLQAFDVYQGCRDQLGRIRANEEKARNTKLLERAQQIIHHHATGQDIDMRDSGQTHPQGGERR